VREPSVIRGARAPLFERLSDEEPGVVQETRPLRILNRNELLGSVSQHVRRLLNTRRHLGSRTGEKLGPTVIEYGIPDFAAFGSSEEERLRLAGIVGEAIQAFEPRLRDVRVRFEPDPTNPKQLKGGVEATLATENVHEPVYFPMLIHARSEGRELEISDLAGDTA
jgi:type VI secretion system lysozyme-like protein